MNKESALENVAITLDTLLATSWLDISMIPNNFSFRCLIKFKEFGIEGIDRNHISTGYWLHKENCFIIDNIEMKNLTPVQFIPIYDNID